MLITETACNDCDHAKVCRHREEFLKAQEAVENASISIGSKPISAIECVEPIKLRCKFREHKVDMWNSITTQNTISTITNQNTPYKAEFGLN